jgi:hypothetical protein
VSYEVACDCGETIRGERQLRHQVLTCPSCGERVFVLPLSPLGTLDAAPAGGTSPWRWWGAPLLAAAGCVGLLLVGFFALRPLLRRDSNGTAAPPARGGDLPGQIDLGRRALGQGKFRLAHKLLREAREMRGGRPEALPAAESRRLVQLYRQADLLARLSIVPLEDIVRRGQLVRDPDEWALEMEDHRGRTFLFDDVIRLDAERRPQLGTYIVEAGDERVRLALEDLLILRDLPLEDEPRLIFGASLAGCEREEGGGWVIHFEPSSGVLMTDLEALVACMTQPPDKEVEQVLARQQRWLDDRVGVRPSRP